MRAAQETVEELIARLRKEFEFISKEAEGIVLYGSHAAGRADARSDIDICIIRPKTREILNTIYAKVGGKYDIQVFENLPLYIKMGVIQNYMVIYGDEPAISYYLYGFRKQWDEMKYRIISNRFSTVSEMVMTRRKWLEKGRQVPVKA